MRNLALISIVLAVISLIMGILMKLGMPPILNTGPMGTIKGASAFLLFGINFELLELLKK